MLISEVESLLGLSKKSIRFYEEEGLITPLRNKNNDYRIYKEEDVEKLKIIKFLRYMDVSIEEIKKLYNNKISLRECLEDKISKIDKCMKNFLIIKNMCEDLTKTNSNLSNINIDEYLEKMNKLNKEGFIMNKKEISHKKKILGALLSSMIFILIFASILTLISYFQFTEKESIPWIIYLFVACLLLTPIISLIFNLVERIKEIIGGEEDEASKY